MSRGVPDEVAHLFFLYFVISFPFVVIFLDKGVGKINIKVFLGYKE